MKYRTQRILGDLIYGVVIFIIVFVSVAVCAMAIQGAEPLPVAEPPASWPTEVRQGQPLLLDATGEDVTWFVLPSERAAWPFTNDEGLRTLLIDTEVSGLVHVSYWDGTTLAGATITVGEGRDDDGQPIPPTPTVGKLHVLLLYESAAGGLTQEQSGIPTASSVLEYLKSHCATEDGVPAYRLLDPDADIDGLPDDWQTVFNRGVAAGAGRFPWLIIASDMGGSYEGPLPADLDAMMELLQIYGGK